MTYSGGGVRVLRARLPILVATIGLAAYACSAPSGAVGQGDLDAGVLGLALESSAAGAPGSGEEGSSSARAPDQPGTAALPAASPPPVSQYVAPYLSLASDTQASCPAGSNLLLGTENSDVLTSASANRCVIAFGSADTVSSSGTNATVLLGSGDDTLMAGPGAKIKGGLEVIL